MKYLRKFNDYNKNLLNKRVFEFSVNRIYSIVAWRIGFFSLSNVLPYNRVCEKK